MKIFDYPNHELTIALPEILLIPEYKNVIDNDSSENKNKAFSKFKYVFLMHDFMSPYREYDDDNRLNACRLDCSELSDEELSAPDVIALCKKHQAIMNSNRVLRTINSMYQSVDKLNVYFDTIDFTKIVESGARKGTLLHDPKQLLDVIGKAGILVETLKELKKQAIDELANPVDVRGSDDKLGFFAAQHAKQAD